MLQIVIATSEPDNFLKLAEGLRQEPRVEIRWAKSRAAAIDIASKTRPALMIIDDQRGDFAGLELVRELITVNASINFAVVSSLSQNKFHAASEGLGILARLSPDPGAAEAHHLLVLLEKLHTEPSALT